MAGFDMDAAPGEPTPTDMLGEMTLENWQSFKLDQDRSSEQLVRRVGHQVALEVEDAGHSGPLALKLL